MKNLSTCINFNKLESDKTELFSSAGDRTDQMEDVVSCHVWSSRRGRLDLSERPEQLGLIVFFLTLLDLIKNKATGAVNPLLFCAGIIFITDLHHTAAMIITSEV